MIRHSKDGYCISLPFVVKCSCKPPEKTTTLLPPVITTDNNLITAHRIGWIIWTHQIIKKMRYQIYEAKSVKHDAQQRDRVSCGKRFWLNTGLVLHQKTVTWQSGGFRVSYHRLTRVNTPDSVSFRRFLSFSPWRAPARLRLKKQKSLENTSLAGAKQFCRSRNVSRQEKTRREYLPYCQGA